MNSEDLIKDVRTFIRIRPVLLVSSPSKEEISEVFPLPTCPTTATSDPWGIVRFILEVIEQIIVFFVFQNYVILQQLTDIFTSYFSQIYLLS